MPLTNREKMRRFRERRLREGMVEFRCWLPPGIVARVKRYIDKARRDEAKGRDVEEGSDAAR